MTDQPPFRPSGRWLQDLGLEIDEQSGTRMVAHLHITPDLLTPWGVVHGGVYTTVVESIGSIGASLAVVERGEFAVGVNNATDFFRSVSEGRIDIVGTPVQQGRTQQVWLVDLRRADDGALVAQGRLRAQNVPLSRVR